MFNVVVKQKELMDALKKAKVTVGKSKDGYEKCAYLKVEDVEGVKILKIITTNKVETAISFCKIVSFNGDNAECSLIEFNTLYQMLETLNHEIDITIEDKDAAGKVSINHQGRKKPIILSSMSASKFVYKNPNESFDLDITMNCSDFKDCLEKAGQVIVTNENMAILDCACFFVKSGQIVVKGMCSNAVRRVIIYSKMIEHKGEGTFFLECHRAKKIISGLNTSQKIKIGVNKNVILLEQGNVRYALRRLAGKFPAVEEHTPENDRYVIQSIFNKDELLNALKRVNILAGSDQFATISINNQVSTIELTAVSGSISEAVATNLAKGQPLKMKIGINPLIDSIQNLSEDYVFLNFFSNASCVVIPYTTEYIHRIAVPAKVLDETEESA